MAAEVLTMPWAIAQLFVLLYESETHADIMRMCAKIEVAIDEEVDSNAAGSDLLEVMIDADDPDDQKALAVWTRFLFELGSMMVCEAENIAGLSQGALFRKVLDKISANATEEGAKVIAT